MRQMTTHDEKITPFPTFNGYYRSRIYTSEVNVNPLIAASDQLLNLITILKSVESPKDPDKFLQDLQHEIRSFEHQAKLANYPTKIITSARYLLCLTLDEAITSMGWQEKERGLEKNLFSLLYNGTYQENRLAQIVEFALTNIKENLHLLELLYLLFNLGMTGRSQNQIYTKSELIALTSRLYQIIGQATHLNCKQILIQEKKEKQASCRSIPNSINRKMLFGGALALAIVLTGVIYLTFYLKLNNAENLIKTTIATTNPI